MNEQQDYGNIISRGKIRKSCRKSEGIQDTTVQNGIGKNIFGKWLMDFRSGQNREVKIHRPVGRTLSANVKDKTQKKRITRTLSACQKDRNTRELTAESSETQNWDSGKYHERDNKGKASENGKGNANKSWLLRIKYRERSFSGSSLDRYSANEDEDEINRSALVSYLDEEGLKKTDLSQLKSNFFKSSEKPCYEASGENGLIMPTSSQKKKPPVGNHYENYENFILNERNKGKNLESDHKSLETDYLKIDYSDYNKKETGKTSFKYYNNHRYENLETTDYISWCSENSSDKFELELDERKRLCDETLGSSATGKAGDPSSDKIVECGFRFGLANGDWCRMGHNVPEAPARDPSSLKSIKYGPGHEKYPSWPGSIKAETGEKPQRSHSWTEQANYSKEKVTSYTRPHTKRINQAFTQQLKTVMERCEKITSESYKKTMEQMDEREKVLYLPRLDREGKAIGDQDYMVPSPPERDKPTLTQADLDKYYQDGHLTKIDSRDYCMPYDEMRKPPPLTEADLEEYAKSYDDALKPLHQHQGSYAQSEGYHSYVSTSELTTTPFLDRLRRDSDSGIRSQQWNEEDNQAGRDSVVTTSSGSASSSETLKWHGSMSDVSVSSSSCKSRQLIVHSSRVPPPQRHHSESVLYLGNQSGNNWQSKGDRSQQLKLFPVHTYTVQPNESSKPVISPTSVPKMSVAERINELERQQAQKFGFYDPEKRHKVSDPTLKAIQKKALLSFYERHQYGTNGVAGVTAAYPVQSKDPKNWKNDQKLGPTQARSVVQDMSQRYSLPSVRTGTTRRSSCASDLSSSSWTKANHSYSCSLVGPAIIGPSISIDDWVPELPPKKPHLRTVPPPLPQRSSSPKQVSQRESEAELLNYNKSGINFERMPTPDLPPPPPPPASEEETVSYDEPLPPPPPELEWHLATAVPMRSTPMSSGRVTPQSPNQYFSAKDCSVIESLGPPEQKENIRNYLVPDAYEIQYDQNAINAIMESNRMAELQKKKCSSKVKHGLGKDLDEKIPLKTHIENRPPLPLPRDVQVTSDRKQETLLNWQKSREPAEGKILFARSFSKPENSSRSSMKMSKSEANSRSSLRCSTSKKLKERQNPEGSGNFTKMSSKNKSAIEPVKTFAVKKVSEYECRIPGRDQDGLTIFETTAIDESKLNATSKGSNSKAAFFAIRREKEMGMTNCEGSYKLTVSQSGERIETENPEKFPLEMIKMREKSSENLVLDNRLSLEPPDLIPKISNLNRKSSSVQDVRDNRKKYDYNVFGNEKYRLVLAAANTANNRLFSENNLQNDYKVTCCVNEENTKDNCEKGRVSSTTTTEPQAIEIECVRAVITKQENEPPPPPQPLQSAPETHEQPKESQYQSQEEKSVEERTTKESIGNEKYGLSFTLRQTEPDKGNMTKMDKAPTLARVRSNIEERLNRSDSVVVVVKEDKLERSNSLKFVERSTSFGRADTMRIVEMAERAETRNANLSVSDASSQTDLLEDEPVPDEATQRKIEDELECERLSRDLASQLPPSDKLQSLLVPDSERRKPTDYVAGLFPLELSSKPRRHVAKNVKSSDKGESTSNDSSQEAIVNDFTGEKHDSVKGSSSPPYFSIPNEFKLKTSAKFSTEDSERDSRHIQKKKEELLSRLNKKMNMLKEEHEAVTNEITANEELGVEVANTVAKSARPHELAKYRLHVEEVGKIASLLLGLSGRLAKVENALLGLPSHHDDRKIQESKRDKLQEQLAEAKQLKENIDKRSHSVAKTLGKYLNADEFADYVHFISMKAKLIVDLREIADNISLKEEQLAALKETLSA